jgi:hypothetical protein
VKGRPKAGSVEYEVYRSQSKGAHPYPWHGLDATAVRRIECTVRVNEWELAVLKYIVGLTDPKQPASERRSASVSSYLLEHGMRAALKRVIDQESRGDADGQ